VQATHVSAEDLNGKVEGAAPRGLDRSEDVELIYKNLSRNVGAAENVQERLWFESSSQQRKGVGVFKIATLKEFFSYHVGERVTGIVDLSSARARGRDVIGWRLADTVDEKGKTTAQHDFYDVHVVLDRVSERFN
jgi:hypothetical protein